ncbi:MAG: LAGLIDADG family homing endonuclease [Candidatus Caldarchaeales archaeon]
MIPAQHRYRPRNLNRQLYPEVLRLHNQGLGYRQIAERIWETHGLWLSRGLISYWIRKIHTPFNDGSGRSSGGKRRSTSVDELKPSRSLAFVTGVGFGDGYVCRSKDKSGWHYYVGTNVTDEDLAVAFAEDLGNVLNRIPPRVRETIINGRRFYVVRVSSEVLYEVLKDKNIDRIRRFIEHSEETKAAFLRGFFDSEGCVSDKDVSAINSDVTVLKYAQRLLADLGIESTGPHLKKEAGTPIEINGRKYGTRKNVYYIYICANSLPIFLEKVGFTVEKKRRKLEGIVGQRQLRLAK